MIEIVIIAITATAIGITAASLGYDIADKRWKDWANRGRVHRAPDGRLYPIRTSIYEDINLENDSE